MNIKLYVGNLSKATTHDELSMLFSQAGKVSAVDVIKDRRTGESRGFAFITMGGPSEADQAVGMFNAYTLNEQVMKVSAAKPIA